MSSKGKKYSNTDPILITILKGWNNGFLSEEAKKSFGNIDTWNLDKHTSFFIWNAIPTYLSDLKKSIIVINFAWHIKEEIHAYLKSKEIYNEIIDII